MIVDLVAAIRCDYCSERITTKAHYGRGGFRLDAPEGWVVFESGSAICSACQRKEPVVHVMQAGVTLCGITEIPANWPSNWKWVSVAQKEFHGQVNCPECLKGLED
jgi:hypothetical protein